MKMLKAGKEQGETEEEFQHLKIIQQWLEVAVSRERQREVERDGLFQPLVNKVRGWLLMRAIGSHWRILSREI